MTEEFSHVSNTKTVRGPAKVCRRFWAVAPRRGFVPNMYTIVRSLKAMLDSGRVSINLRMDSKRPCISGYFCSITGHVLASVREYGGALAQLRTSTEVLAYKNRTQFDWIGDDYVIAHFVLMNLHESSDAELVASEILSLHDRIPGLTGIEGGPSMIANANTWDLGFLMLFRDKESAVSYQSHPAHVQVAQKVKGLLSGMATCDVQTGEPLLHNFAMHPTTKEW